MTTAYDLPALRKAACIACMEALNVRGSFAFASVNWGDFLCSSAERYEDDNGTTGYRVVIEEADPSNRQVGEFIARSLAAAGFADVDVIFEW